MKLNNLLMKLEQAGIEKERIENISFAGDSPEEDIFIALWVFSEVAGSLAPRPAFRFHPTAEEEDDTRDSSEVRFVDVHSTHGTILNIPIEAFDWDDLKN